MTPPPDQPSDQPIRVAILGSTGSIGTQTLDVIEHLNTLHARGLFPRWFKVTGLAARTNSDLLAEQARAHSGAQLALADKAVHYAGPGSPIRGDQSALDLVRSTPADIVVAAMVGAAGLPATLAAVEAGTTVALANKETLVVAGSLITAAAQNTGASLLPLDSEHAGVWQALAGVTAPQTAPPFMTPDSVRQVVLTASGGAFRDKSITEIENATPEQALAHPTWNMGTKVTIDSATLMNKGLELIEAHHLFGLNNDRLGVLIHRQSVIHALAEMVDGAIIAHLSATDMRHPIHAALAFPHACESHPAARMDLDTLTRLDFQPLDPDRFPAIELARRVIDEPSTTIGAIFNAANEAAVAAFLAGRAKFGDITSLVERTLDDIEAVPLTGLESALEADRMARAQTERHIASAPQTKTRSGT